MGQDRVNAQIHLSGQNFDVKLDYQGGELIARLYNGEPAGEWPKRVKLADVKRARLRLHHGAEGVDERSPWASFEALHWVALYVRADKVRVELEGASVGAHRLAGWLVNLDEGQYMHILKALHAFRGGVQ